MGLIEQAVLRTILYADIFDFPLTVSETWQYLLTHKKDIPKARVEKTLRLLTTQKILSQKHGFFSLQSKKTLLERRKTNMRFCTEKNDLAEKASHILSTIPSVLFIGVSGSLAVGNVREKDDIDFFIISEKKYLWMTRLLSVYLLSKHNIRRTREDAHESNKICLNMFLSEDGLSFPKKRQDIYTAHEIAQLKPLFMRGDIYTLLLQKNDWIYSLLPNAPKTQQIKSHPKNVRSAYQMMYTFPMVQLAELIQRVYMLPHKTTEQVTSTLFAFHPRDYRPDVLKAYKKRLNFYKLSEI